MDARHYWVMKGCLRNRYDRNGDILGFVQSKEMGYWYQSQRLNKNVQKGDRIFCWRGYPHCDVVGLAEIKEIDQYDHSLREHAFIVKPLCWFPYFIHKADLEKAFHRFLRKSKAPSFLGPGPQQTIQPINDEHAKIIAFQIIKSNNELPVASEAMKTLFSWFPSMNPQRRSPTSQPGKSP